VIGVPFNDLRCLGSITEVVAELVDHRDPLLVEIAAQHPTVAGLVDWIRALPQRDDEGAKTDGPKVDSCDPPQRLRIPADDPNCVERAALFLAVAELIDPAPIRQLVTLDTEVGLHTFPIENGAPVILDPRLPRNCMDGAMAIAQYSPVPVEARDAIEWTTRLAEAGAADFRNGPSRVRHARNAIMKLVDEGAAPADATEIDAMGWLLALAERAAHRYGTRAIAIVRSTAEAVADLADQALARAQRNLAVEVGGTTFRSTPWLSALGRATANIGLDVASVAARAELAHLGVGDDVTSVVEQELNKQGLTLGTLARPPRMPTFERFAKRAA